MEGRWCCRNLSPERALPGSRIQRQPGERRSKDVPGTGIQGHGGSQRDPRVVKRWNGSAGKGMRGAIARVRRRLPEAGGGASTPGCGRAGCGRRPGLFPSVPWDGEGRRAPVQEAPGGAAPGQEEGPWVAEEALEGSRRWTWMLLGLRGKDQWDEWKGRPGFHPDGVGASGGGWEKTGIEADLHPGCHERPNGDAANKIIPSTHRRPPL